MSSEAGSACEPVGGEVVERRDTVWVEEIPGVKCGAWNHIEERMCRRSPSRGFAGAWFGGGSLWLCDVHAERAADGMLDAVGDDAGALALAVMVGDGPMMSDAALAEFAAANPPEPIGAEEDRPVWPGRPWWTYVFARPGWVKIGKSVDVQRRLRQVNDGSALVPWGMVFTPAKLVFALPYDCETDLHNRFAPLRDRGEWFRHEGEVATWIADVLAAPPDGLVIGSGE